MQVNSQRIVIVGFGSIGQALMALLREHFRGWQVHVLEADVDQDKRALCAAHGAALQPVRVTEDNYRALLKPLLCEGAFLLNLATSACTRDLIRLAQSLGAFYLDTCIDPWVYEAGDNGISTSNYALREEVLGLRERSPGGRTAIVAHGANPGFVSVLLKQGLEEMARANGLRGKAPQAREDWAALARALDVRVIQVSERDTQVGLKPRADGEFVCTWSVDGLVTECLQPAELGWGTHEPRLPAAARQYGFGSGAGISIQRPSYTVRVKSWSPNALDFDAYLITHNEALSIADYLTVSEAGEVRYRPTTYYAYRPCDEAVDSFALLAGGTARAIRRKRVLRDEIASGIDELGIFLISAAYPSYWIGSNLSIGKARKMAAHNNATSLQVVSSLVAGMKWALEHPQAGIVESEQLDHRFVYEFVEPYWAPIVRQSLAWKPVPGASGLAFDDFLVEGRDGS
jgi:homospermidine synthase